MTETARILHTTAAPQEGAIANAAAALDRAILDLWDIAWTARHIEELADCRSDDARSNAPPGPDTTALPEPDTSPTQPTVAPQPVWRRLRLLSIRRAAQRH